MAVTVKLGFVPSIRWRYTDWAQKMRDDSLAAFAKLSNVEVFVPTEGPDPKAVCAEDGYTPYGMVTGLDQGEAIAEFFAAKKVDAVVLCPLDFGDERSASKIAEKLRVPVLLYATKEPEAPNNSGLTRTSDSYCGNLSMASGLYRRKLAFHYAGLFFPWEEEFFAEVDAFVRAVAVVKGLKNARIGQVGVRPPTFETVGYDEAAMIEKFGQNVIYTEVSDVVAAAKAIADDDPRVKKVIGNLKEKLTAITVADKYLVNSAKMEIALSDWYKGNKLSAMAVQCWPSVGPQMGISMCALYGRLTGNEMLTACETDTLGALAMIVNHQAALGETLPHFIDWTIQHRENPNWLLAWHCGNAPLQLAEGPTALRSRKDMKGELPVDENDVQAGLFQFQIKPGVVTFCRLQEYDNEWKMLIATGRIVPSDETLAGTWSWVEVSDHEYLYRTLVEEGFVHHASMIHGDQTEALVLACKFLDIEPIVVA